jgi:hypothetical protein
MDILDIENPEIVAAGGQSLSAILESLPDARRMVVQAWIDGLRAERWQYDLVTKQKVVEPDHRERRENAKLLAAYLDGLPKETTVVTVKGDAGGQLTALREAARSSPAIREALREMLDELEKPAIEA